MIMGVELPFSLFFPRTSPKTKTCRIRRTRIITIYTIVQFKLRKRTKSVERKKKKKREREMEERKYNFLFKLMERCCFHNFLVIFIPRTFFDKSKALTRRRKNQDSIEDWKREEEEEERERKKKNGSGANAMRSVHPR